MPPIMFDKLQVTVDSSEPFMATFFAHPRSSASLDFSQLRELRCSLFTADILLPRVSATLRRLTVTIPKLPMVRNDGAHAIVFCI